MSLIHWFVFLSRYHHTRLISPSFIEIRRTRTSFEMTFVRCIDHPCEEHKVITLHGYIDVFHILHVRGPSTSDRSVFHLHNLPSMTYNILNVT